MVYSSALEKRHAFGHREFESHFLRQTDPERGFLLARGKQSIALRVDSKDGATPVLVKTGRESGSRKFLSVGEEIICDRDTLPPPKQKRLLQAFLFCYNSLMITKNPSLLLARLALLVVYFWFGLLKVLGMSPGSEMVEKILGMTMPFFLFSTFIILFGLFEMLIGILFLIPKWEKFAVGLFALHMFTTTLPLFFMGEVWTSMFVPTLEGQYIVKNLALIACAACIYTSTRND